MTSTADLAVIGSGSLARAVCCSLAVAARDPLRITVLGRSERSAGEVAYLGQTRSRLSGAPVRFEARPLSDLEIQRPDVALVCASEHSPWEKTSAPSAWTELIAAAGFGITLPLQATLALRVRLALPDALVVNACFPDAVNPLLKAYGAPVFCGVGNVAIIAASLAAALDVQPERLQLLAHHSHLHGQANPDDQPLAWLDGEQLSDVGQTLAAQHRPPGAQLNLVTGHSAALLLLGILRGNTGRVNVPGPLGLPGGYPSEIKGSEIALDLPPGWSETDAVAFNQRAAHADGVVVGDEAVRFTPRAQAALREVAPKLCDGFAPSELLQAAQLVRELRDRLRQ